MWKWGEVSPLIQLRVQRASRAPLECGFIVIYSLQIIFVDTS